MTIGTKTEAVQAFVDLGGVHTYFEAVGDGPPVVLLHGGMCPIETWGGLIPQLAPTFRVYAPERRGHGRTADVEGPLTYEIMAADTIAFLEHLAVGPVDLLGWSDGAVVALLVALWRPDLVQRLVYVGNFINQDGMPSHVKEMLPNLSTEMLPPMLRQLHAAVSPDGPEHFEVIFGKLKQLWTKEPDLDLGQLASLRAPTLFVAADSDMVTVEHLAAARTATPDAQLAVVPGADHGFPIEHPDLLAQLALRFLS
jgi:pimeloyl-ACP methyl ester carboxylesterase